MIVIDASAIVDAVTDQPRKPSVLAAITREELHAPALIDFEVAAALRGRIAGGWIDEDAAGSTLARYLSITIHRHPGDALAPSILRLRHYFTAYDASYVALAEALDAPLVTADAKMLEARRLGVDVRVFS